MSFKYCPGVKDLVGPAKIIVRSCPACGEEVEFFSDETETECSKCGKSLHREASPSCVTWCEYYDKCLDDLKERGLMPTSRVEELKHLAKTKKDQK
jgi:hypothetical protein